MRFKPAAILLRTTPPRARKARRFVNFSSETAGRQLRVAPPQQLPETFGHPVSGYSARLFFIERLAKRELRAVRRFGSSLRVICKISWTQKGVNSGRSRHPSPIPP